MQGAKRVLLFCVTITVFPSILIIVPLYLRHIVYSDVVYAVTESDVLEINEGISSIFCSEQTLQMNTTFNAFQLKELTTINAKRKHIRLKKSMSLPDDTLEYWGFYLLKGATVYLKVCSRYEGSRILVVRGEKNLRTCGLREHNYKKFGAAMDQEYMQVKVIYESAQEIGLSGDDNSEVNNSSIGNEYKLHNTRNKKLFEKPSELHSNEQINFKVNRTKRNTNAHIFDTKIEHGGDAVNRLDANSGESSVSSFENNLLNCYNGQILLAKGFSPSHLCTDVHYLEKNDSMAIVHNIASDGYYYYIFYSDNDFTKNDIHAVFDIHKPTLQFADLAENKSCINTTTCTFTISFMSKESVVVEIPMRDGIEHGSDDDDVTNLISSCRPRTGIYIFFPIGVILVILGCAFV